MGLTYLDDRDDKLGSVLKLAHINVEVVQVVSLGLLQHHRTSLSHGADAPQIARGIDVGIGRLGHLDLGNGRRDGGVGHLGEAGRLEGGLGGGGLDLCEGGGVLACRPGRAGCGLVFAREEPHSCGADR